MRICTVFLLYLVPILAYSTAPKICLHMIVCNQEKTIHSSLDSVRGFVDCISICDVGSIDGTIHVIEDFLRHTGIPGVVHRAEKWPAVHSSLSMYIAQKTIEDLGFSPANFYIFTLDGNKAVHFKASFTKESLRDESYAIAEKVPYLGHERFVPHLFRASLLQNLDALPLQSHPKLTDLTIIDIDDGEKTAHLERNILLWKKTLETDPNNALYILWIAEAQLALGRYEEAIQGFQSRIEKGGDSEEVWLSKFKLGECYERRGDWNMALHWYLDAYQYSSSRSDPIGKIANHYRLTGQNDISYIFAKHGLRIPSSTTKNLFPYPPFEDYQFDEELSIVAFYTRYKEEGYTAASDLLLRKNVPEYIRDHTYENIRYYISSLQNIRYIPIQIDLPFVEEGFDERYHPMNPSILKTADGYKVICRTVNYTQVGAKNFHTIDAQGIFRTRNFLLDYTPDFQLLAQREIVEDSYERRPPAFVEGLEDCRLFEYDQHLCFTTASWNTHDSNVPQISLCRLDKEPTGDLHYIDKPLPLFGPDPNRCEKNWLPFVKNGQIHIIYGYDPFTVYQPNLVTGATKTVFSYKPEQNFSRFRGSAAPVEFDGGYLMLVHEVTFLADYHRCYLHRFLYLDADLRVKKCSKPFVFTHFGVEFCNGIAIDHSETQLILGIGIEDREAYLGFMDLSHVRGLLR